MTMLLAKPRTAHPAMPAAIVSSIKGDPAYLTLPCGRIIGYAVASISPAVAQLIAGANYRNRRDHRVAFYARMMIANLWKLVPQGLTFFDNGDRADGDHRITAVIQSETTQEFIVSWGWSIDIVSALDCGLPRVAADYLKATLGLNWSHTDIGAMRIVAAEGAQFLERVPLANEALADLAVVFQGAVEFSKNLLKGKGKNGIYRVEVMCVLMAAYIRNQNDADKISRFAHGLMTGLDMNQDHEQTAIVCRNLLLELRGKSSTEERYKIIASVGLALDHFLSGRRVTILRPSKYVNRLGSSLSDIRPYLALTESVRAEIKPIIGSLLSSVSAD